MKLFERFEQAVFISRLNRFVVQCALRNKVRNAYLPNPGKLLELLLPGSILYLVKQSSSSARMDYMAVAVEKDGVPVMLHTHLNNSVARHLIERDLVPGLEGSVIIRPEVTFGKSRFDFLLRKGDREIVLEVKSCTLFSEGIAMFPDAATTRGRRHLVELSSLSRRKRKAAVLFIVHSPDARFFLPEYHTDLEFSRTLLSVSKNITVNALSVTWDRALTLGAVPRELVIPWDFISHEAQDRGSYIVILCLKKKINIPVGGLGSISFPEGYYLYTGSARTNLSSRIARHERRRKNLFWHIDYLREHADVRISLPVRSGDDLECEIANALKAISQWSVPGFGCSDCVCESHLFGMSEDPLRSPAFIHALMYFRIDRLQQKLSGGLAQGA